MTMKEAINKVIKGQNLTLKEAKEVMGLMLGGEATQAQLGSFLTALRMKGETIDEILSLKDIHCQVDIPETADTLEGNSLLKAQYIREHYGMDCFADDTGLEVEALNGAPGV